MKTLFKNGLILIDNEFRYAHILVEDANILAISHSLDDLKDFDKEEDLAGKYSYTRSGRSRCKCRYSR